jgi:hypothetical protein
MISSRALTTREDDKGIYMQKNPFNVSPWFLNLVRKLCTSLPPSACEYMRGKLPSNNCFFLSLS